MKFLRSSILLCAIALSACTGMLTAPAAPASTAPPPAVTPLGNTVVDEQAVHAAYQGLDLAATAIDALLALKRITPGSPTAVKIADLLDLSRRWVNFADSARRAGNATAAASAFVQAQAAITDLTAAITGK